MDIPKRLRYGACMLLAAWGDTIGFYNGIYEFNNGEDFSLGNPKYGTKFMKNGADYSNYLIFDFIAHNGLRRIDFSSWKVSDDTILHMATAKALLANYKTNNELYKKLVEEYVATFENKKIGMLKWRAPGNRTIKSIEMIQNKTPWNKMKYMKNGGGSGGSMRSMCIGLAFPGKKNRSQLIKVAIISGMITHNNAVGYLGSLVSALFTAYAIEDIKPDKWPFKLVGLLESDTIDKFIKKCRPDTYEDYIRDKDYFLDKWKDYIEDSFDSGKFRLRPLMIIPSYRSEWYYKFSYNKNTMNPGSSGHDSVIIAYDCLMYCRNNWEKLVYYSMLHVGDSDTTGTIAAAWFGSLYGMEDAVEIFSTEQVEYVKEIGKLGMDLYEKYYKS